jgi:hypothetical protein
MDETALFTHLEPPAGGLARLRRAITAREVPVERWWLPATGGIAAALLLAPLLHAERVERVQRQQIVSAVVASVADQPAHELPSTRDDVRIFVALPVSAADTGASSAEPE